MIPFELTAAALQALAVAPPSEPSRVRPRWSWLLTDLGEHVTDPGRIRIADDLIVDERAGTVEIGAPR